MPSPPRLHLPTRLSAAHHRAQDAKGRDISFLAEVLLDAEQYTMGTTFKCDSK